MIQIASKANAVHLIKSPASGVVLSITNEGDCARIQVQAVVPSAVSDNSVTDVAYSFDSRCNVRFDGVKKLGQLQFRSVNGYGTDTPAIMSMEDVMKSSASDIAPAHVIYGNYIHTSQTVQDVIFIDIAKLQEHADRNWDGGCSWWKSDVWAQSSTSVSWDHPSGAPWFVGNSGTQCRGTLHPMFWKLFQKFGMTHNHSKVERATAGGEET